MLFRSNEFAARLPAVICAVALVVITCRIGARWFSPVTGFAAGFGLLTCVQMLMHGRSAVADMPMVVCVLLAQFALWELLQEPAPRWWWLLWVAVGVGFLAKGPVVVVVPVLTLVLYRWVLWRQPVPWRRLRLGWGLVLALVIVGAWGVPALVRTHGDFFRVGIGQHVVKRGFASFQGHGAVAPYYYFATALLSLFPWIAFAGDGVRVTRQNWNAKNAFLVSWVAGTYLLFTVYLTKLPHYVLPAFPALFLLLGQTCRVDFQSARRSAVWFWIVCGLGLFVATASVVVAVVQGEHWFLPGLAVACIVTAVTAVAVFWRAGWLRATLGAVMALSIGIAALGTAARSLLPTIEIARLTQDLPASTKCGAWQFNEPSLVFYTARQWEPVRNVESLQLMLAAGGPCLLVAQERETKLDDLWKQWRGRPARRPVDAPMLAALESTGLERRDVAGLNIARASWIKLRVYYRAQ